VRARQVVKSLAGMTSVIIGLLLAANKL